jgi:hypothetical protein
MTARKPTFSISLSAPLPRDPFSAVESRPDHRANKQLFEITIQFKLGELAYAATAQPRGVKHTLKSVGLHLAIAIGRTIG